MGERSLLEALTALSESSLSELEKSTVQRQRQRMEREDLPFYDRMKAIREIRQGVKTVIQSMRTPEAEVDLINELQILRNSTAVAYFLEQQSDLAYANSLLGLDAYSSEFESPLQVAIRRELYKQRLQHRRVMQKKIQAERLIKSQYIKSGVTRHQRSLSSEVIVSQNRLQNRLSKRKKKSLLRRFFFLDFNS